MNGQESILFALAVALAGPILLVAVLFHYLPQITRRDIFFAVTVNPEFRGTAEARRIVRRYRTTIWSQTAIAFGIAAVAIATRRPLVALVGVGWQVATATWAFLRARKQVMPHAAAPTTHREATLVPRAAAGVGFALLQIGPFAILVAAAIYIQIIWDRIPARFPIHWGFDGRPNGWATRSFWGIYGFWLIGLITCAFMDLLAYGILHWTRQIRSSGADAQNEAYVRRVQAGCIIALEYFFALIFNGIPFTAFRGNMNQAPSVMPFLLGTFGFVGVLIGIMIHTGQGGANLTTAGASSDIVASGPVIGDRTPDKCWRAGEFYVNPDDPAILVEKRFGIGYTFNFARPAAWVLMSLILALPAAILVIVFHSAAHH